MVPMQHLARKELIPWTGRVDTSGAVAVILWKNKVKNIAVDVLATWGARPQQQYYQFRTHKPVSFDDGIQMSVTQT